MAPRVFVADLLQEHFDEVVFLIGERQQALCSKLYITADLRQLDERIAANFDGLQVGAQQAQRLALTFLKAEEADTVCAAAMFLLRTRDQGAATAVVRALENAKAEPAVVGLCNALCKGPIDLVAGELRSLFDIAPARISMAAAEVLATSGKLDPAAPRLAQMFSDKDPLVRRAAWRATAEPGNLVSSDNSLDDPDPLVRRNAMINAACAGSKWTIDYCRRAASAPAKENWDALPLLAILGSPSDVERIRLVGRAASLGPQRFEILGVFGHPLVVADLFVGMESKDPATAAAAGVAFTKMTGVDIGSGKRVEAESDKGSDAFEKEFRDEVVLPSVVLARRHWTDHEQRYMQGVRWCRGIDVSNGLPLGAEDSLDLESLWEASLRGRFAGVRTSTRLHAEQLAAKLS